MIARLQGAIESRGEDWVILDVRDVGYIVYCSSHTLARLPAPGIIVALHVETYVRAEAITLYGFLDCAERDWFRLLTTVQGVGAKVALHLLSALTPDQLALALAAQDKAILTRAVGVGPRLAARLLIELKDKVVGLALPVGGADTGINAGAGREVSAMPRTAAATDAVSALVNLGYGRADALAVVARAEASFAHEALQASPDVGMLLRAALRAYARGNGG